MHFKGSHIIFSMHASPRRRTDTKKAIEILNKNNLLKGPTRSIGKALALKIRRREWITDEEWHHANRVVRQHAEALAGMANRGLFKLGTVGVDR